MDKFKITLLILFIIGIIGALNSISNQSNLEEEKGFVNGILNVLGLAYKPEPQEARDFDYVPAKTQSELSKIAQNSQNSTPSASEDQKIQQTDSSPVSTPKPDNLNQPPKDAAAPSPSSSPNPYGFGFSN